MKAQNVGFTLIELLISVLIIGILTSIILVVINPAQIRGRARDGQRISELKTIQVALEQYYLTNRSYPSSITSSTSWSTSAFILINGSTDRLSTSLIPTFVSKVPVDPSGGSSSSNPCSTSGNYGYYYVAPPRSTIAPDNTKADKYILASLMEVKTVNDGNECGRLVNWGGLCTTSDPAGAYTCPGNSLSGNDPVFSTCDFCYGVENK